MVDSTSPRIDHSLTSTVHVFVRAAYTPSSTGTRFLSDVGNNHSGLQSYTSGVDSQIRPSVSNQLRVGYTRFVGKQNLSIDNFGGATPTNLSQLLDTGGSRSANPEIDLYLTAPNNTSLQTSLQTSLTASYGRQWNITDTVNWSQGRHLIKAGIDYLAGKFGRPPIVIGHGYANNKIIRYQDQSGDKRVMLNVLTTLGSVKKYRPDIWDAVLESADKMQGRALVIQGAIDELIEAKPRADEFVATAMRCKVDVAYLDGGNHYFHGKEAELGKAIVAWLAENAE